MKCVEHIVPEDDLSNASFRTDSAMGSTDHENDSENTSRSSSPNMTQEIRKKLDAIIHEEAKEDEEELEQKNPLKHNP